MPAGTTSDLIKVHFMPDFRDNFERDNIWLPRVRDYSAEFQGNPNGGKNLKIPVDFSNYGPANDQLSGGTGADDVDTVTAAGTPALGDDTHDEDTVSLAATRAGVSWQPPTLMQLGEVELEIDKIQSAAMLITYTQEKRTLPELVTQAATRLGIESRIRVNRYIRDTIFASADNYTLADAAITVADASDDWGNANHLSQVYEALKAACLKADSWQWPRMGRTVIVGPAVYQLIVQDMINKNIHFQGNANDQGYIDGRTPGVWGWNIVMDMDIPIAHAAPADGVNHTLYFLSERMGIGYASDIMRMRSFESEVRMGWLIQFLSTWGADVLNKRYQFKVQTTITAA